MGYLNYAVSSEGRDNGFCEEVVGWGGEDDAGDGEGGEGGRCGDVARGHEGVGLTLGGGGGSGGLAWA